MRFTLTSLLFLVFCTFQLSAQQVQNEERLIRLIKAKTAESYQSEFRNIRRVTGPAQFFHNNTIFLCDTAIISIRCKNQYLSFFFVFFLLGFWLVNYFSQVALRKLKEMS